MTASNLLQLGDMYICNFSNFVLKSPITNIYFARSFRLTTHLFPLTLLTIMFTFKSVYRKNLLHQLMKPSNTD